MVVVLLVFSKALSLGYVLHALVVCVRQYPLQGASAPVDGELRGVRTTIGRNRP